MMKAFYALREVETMLEELYKYAVDNGITARPGFKEKGVKYYISFDVNGSFVGFDAAEDGKKATCPDMGSAAQSTSKSNIIAEKADIVLNLPDKDGKFPRQAKHDFYMSAMREIAGFSSAFAKVVNSLEEQRETIISNIPTKKFKHGDLISIKFDGNPLENDPCYFDWWEEFRARNKEKKTASKPKKGQSGKVRCFITGELTEPVRTAPKFSGLLSVGGHTSGDTIIGFDKDAYCSYGFTQAANAAVSDEAITAVNAALNQLLSESKSFGAVKGDNKDNKRSNILAGAKNIHWYSGSVENDILEVLDFDFGFSSDSDEQSEPDEKQSDNARVRKMFDSIFKGECPEEPKNRYYMMSLSGVNGRVMVRSYDEGTYGELFNSIKQWYEDLSLCGKRYPKMFTIYTRLVSYSTSGGKFSERINKELSGISPRIIYAITHNTELPDTVAAKTISYIRHDMYNSSDDEKHKRKNIDRVSCQILKVWLNRKYRNQNKEEYLIMENLNPDSPSKAYQLGRMIAVYAAIQNKALGDVNAGVVERYFTSACTSPALVFGKLAMLSQHHLSKLGQEQKGSEVYFDKMLSDIASKIGNSLPKTFTLEQQSEFALGYYAQNEEIYKKKTVTEE